MSVIQLTGPSFRPRYIELDGGIVTSASVTDGGGTRPLTTRLGAYRFFVHLVEEDGGRLGLWEGASLGDAMRQAQRARSEFEISAPVRDLFGGAS